MNRILGHSNNTADSDVAERICNELFDVFISCKRQYYATGSHIPSPQADSHWSDYLDLVSTRWVTLRQGVIVESVLSISDPDRTVDKFMWCDAKAAD